MWDNASLLARIANFLLGLSALAILYGTVHYIVHLPALLPVKTVRLANTPERISDAVVLEVVRRGVQGNFLTVNIEKLRVALQAVPWVKSVSISRQFPDSLVLKIEEHQPVARWNDDALVDKQGEVFVAETSMQLPRFIGIDGSSAEVLDEYGKFSEQLAVLNLKVSQIVFSARHAWQLGLSNGTVVELGREALQERVERFVAYRKSMDDAAKMGDGKQKAEGQEVVDMRYRHGFAVRVIGKAEG